jgi:hypothetical protein
VRLIRSLLALLVVSMSWVCLSQDRQVPNGISVGRPKVFDNRTLTLMLESLSATLQSNQTQFIDQKSVAAALGLLQGFKSSDVSSNLTVSTLPIPGITQQNVKNTGIVDSNGNPLPNTTQQTTTLTRDSLTPQVPTLDTNPATPGFTPNYGENASDLLNDQVNLSYQIFNLRMLLERSLSDRLEDDKTRLQAVLGFNVTVDPPRTANDAVAVVEISLTSTTGDTSGNLSLVSLMPQEKTYNSAALSTKSNAFGGAAVVKMIQVGYSQRRRSQVFYLYRDNDTVSYERMDDSDPKKIIFGWMFRPVLGRHSVSPGLRQLFAIVALPGADLDVSSAQQLSASVRTYWKKYDSNTMTSFENKDANRASRVHFGLSLGLMKPEIFQPRYMNAANYTGIAVRPTTKYQESLQPTIDQISWVPVGAKTALVSAVGNNFFTGTQVVLGDKTYSSSTDGLLLKSNQAFDLTTSIDALTSGSGAVIGRYGPAVPLIVDADSPAPGVKIDRFVLGPSLSGSRTLDLHLTDSAGAALTLKSFPKQDSGRQNPVITVNGNVIPLPYTFYEDGSGVTVQGTVQDSFVTGATDIVKISWPFVSDGWTAVKHYSDPSAAYQVTRLSAKTILLTVKDLGLTINPTTMDLKYPQPAADPFCWEMLSGDKAVKLKSPNCSKGDSESTSFSDKAVAVTLSEAIPDKIALLAPWGATFPLDVPKLTPADPAAPKSIPLNQYDWVWVDVPGDDLATATKALANNLTLKVKLPDKIKPGEKVKTVKVEITRDITAKPGNIDLFILDKDGKPLGTARLQITCTQCKTDGGK